MRPFSQRVGEASGSGQVVEAGAGPEPERHLLAELDPGEAEQVAERGRAAMVSGKVAVAGDEGRLGRRGHRLGLCLSCAADGEPRHSPAAADAHPRPHAGDRACRPGDRGERRVRRDLGRDRARRRRPRPAPPPPVADRRRARPRRDRAQLRGQAARPAPPPGARGPAAARAALRARSPSPRPTRPPRSPRRRRCRGSRRAAARRCSPRRRRWRSPAPTSACTTPPTCSPAPPSAPPSGRLSRCRTAPRSPQPR